MIQATPRIYVSCLAAYNNGMLHGAWIDCDKDTQEIYVAIQDILDHSPIENAEEWAIHDFEGFGSFKVEEYGPIDKLSELAAAIAEHGEIISGIMDWRGGTVDQAIETLQDNYCGEYDNKVDFAEQYADNCGYEVPSWIGCHVDWEGIARDMFWDGFHAIEMNGSIHVFYDH